MGHSSARACVLAVALLGCAGQVAKIESAPVGVGPDRSWECTEGLSEEHWAYAQAEADAAFFASADWTPIQVPAGCTGERAAPQPLLEARARTPLEGALPGLYDCMALHDTPELALAIEIDGATGCVTAAMAASSSRNTALDACVASAASRALFDPKSAPKHKLVRIWRPTDQQALSLGEPQQLVPVHSRCPSPRDPARRELPTRDEIRAAYDGAAAAVDQCMDIWDHRPGQAFAFNVHGPTGQVVAAAMVQEPRSARVDACVADALATTCFVPFEAPKETYPFWSVRMAFPRRPEPRPRVPVSRCTVERTEKNFQPTPRELAEAFALVRADVQRCMADHGITAPLYLDVRVHGPTGRIADANLENTPKNTLAHACIERALSSWCIAPFVASNASEPYLKLRLPFIPAGYGSASADRDAVPR